MTLRTELYPYQVAAVKKLLPLRIGALYMEMGTGKTRTTLEIIKSRLEAGKIDCIIWLCPCSVKMNLKNDILYHCGKLPDCITICGIETLSTSIRENVRLAGIVGERTMIIVDESNLVKNPHALRTEHITKLAKKCRYRMILNGTPITRNYADLFSQWYILDWRVLGYRSFYSFAANHLQYDDRIPGKIVRNLNVDYLARRIAPYTYQVTKTEVLDLPKKLHNTCIVHMTDKQKEEYHEVGDAMISMLDDCIPETIYRMFSALQSVISGNYVTGLEQHLKSYPMFNDPSENPRIQGLLDVIDNNVQNEKAIIFCKFTREIHDIIALLNNRYGKGSAVEFTGELSQTRRNKNIEIFRTSAQFLVANKTCAGYGLNLQFCHNVIFYSNDFNWGTRQQAEDRVHRIGQSNEVYIWDIICNNTLDEIIVDCLSHKENLHDRFKNEIKKLKDSKTIARKWILGGNNNIGKDL